MKVLPGIDQEGRAFEVTRFVMRADLGALDYDLRVED
jgi:GntR family transcriptional regulator